MSDTPPELRAYYFEHPTCPQFVRLARVLERSARTHCPTWSIVIERLAPPVRRGHAPDSSALANTVKLETWNRDVQAAPDGARLLLLDVDTVILRPLDPLWDRPFDVAYAERAGVKLPLNGGVIAVRVSDAVRRFFADWTAANARMLTDRTLHQLWKRKYGGLNQAALGFVLEEGGHALTWGRLPCVEWNCEDSTWSAFDPAVTRIVHLKSALRQAIFGSGPRAPHVWPLAQLWRRLEREAA